MGCDGSGCPPPSWSDFKDHASACLGAWVFVTIAGLIASSLRHKWDVERTSEFLTPFVIFLTEDRYYLFLQMAGCLWMCTFYVLYSRDDVVESWNKIIEVYVFTGMHALEVLIICIYSSAQSQEELVRLSFGRLFVDCILIVSMFMRGMVASYFSFSFIAAMRLKMLWTMFERTLDPFRKGLKVKIFHEIVLLTSVIFTAAALFHNLESFTGEQWLKQSWKSWEATNDPTEHWTISASLYVVLCTISTVGYGDVQPRTMLGQIVLIVIIVVGLGMSFYTVVGFLEGIQHTSRGGGEYHIHSATRRRRHIVVVGTPSAQTVKELLLEIYHPDHEIASQGLDTIVMLLPGQQAVMDSLKRFLHEKANSKLLSKVWLLQGSPLHRTDLMRAQAAPYVRLVSLLMKVEFKALMASVGLERKDIACIDELKLGIMGKACVSQGFATLVCNLFKSSGDYNPTQEEEKWIAHYCRGMGNELYEVRLSPAYRGAPFGEVALDILQRSDNKAYMIGVVDDSRYPGEEPVIHIHPGRYFKIGTDEDYVIRGVFIAPDLGTVQQHAPDKPFSWNLDRAALALTGGSVVGMHGSVPGQVCHPNDIPETLQGWIPNKKQIKRDYKKETVDFMLTTAVQQTVQGLKHGANMDRSEIEEIIDMKVPMNLWVDAEITAVEDQAERATDPRQKAILQQQLRAAKAQHKEKQQVKAEENTRREAKMRKLADKFVRAAAVDNDMRDDPHKEAEREMDDMLWGGPQTPRRSKWGDASEPPTTLLVRGEHIVILTLEGNEDTDQDDADGHEVEPAGRKLGLEHFMGAVRAEVPGYAQRPVVVLSQRVPYDWPKVSSLHKDVYLITGRPLSEENIRRAGINHAKAVVIYQRGPVTTHDPTLVDAQVIFGTVLAESLLERMGKECLVLVDVNLDANHSYIKFGAKKNGPSDAPDLNMRQAKKLLEKEDEHYMMSRRFVTGQLFASSAAITSLVANMMYNSALGSLVIEMLRSRFITIPLPRKPDFLGTTFCELFEYMLRRRNLVVIGLLRRFDDDVDDEEEDEEHKKKRQQQIDQKEPYRDDEQPSKRYIYTMPEGSRLLSGSDGIICIAPK
eukprot:CAMPEP_0169409960 /NCGR_PEP_ID=MMETSP1017-20121227/59526_1 /TAXON_ID=342587 /ORGANISM="Karlodinium micrum, Strain CCMP2283" /LENGTH=1088 /DNA_ID=CAMNT_0009517193 /DNA_START=13 /DNA_END=3277 /DNA_ORIENTATION=+